MSFNWKEFHKVGDHLKQYPQEAYQRSAVGRYYYSCYAPVRKYFEAVFGVIGSDENPHKIIIEYLQRSNDEKENELGEYMHKLRGYRNNADYQDSFKRNNVLKAEKTSKDIDDLLVDLINEKKKYGFFKF